MSPSPCVVIPGQSLEIPTPFDYVHLSWHDGNQPKWTHLSQRQLSYTICDVIRARFSGKRPNNFSTADDVMFRIALDPMPINQREANANVIRRNPCAACRLTRNNGAVALNIKNRGRESAKPVQFFVAIHREIKTL